MRNIIRRRQKINLFVAKSIKIGLFAFGLVLFFTACEGSRCGDGTVYDSQTKQPINSVLCKVLSACADEIQYSDSLGKFELCNCFGGCVPDCPDIKIEFSKEGYKTQTVTNPNKASIYLDKE